MPGTPELKKVYDCILHLPILNLYEPSISKRTIWTNKTGKDLMIREVKFKNRKRARVEYINAKAI